MAAWGEGCGGPERRRHRGAIAGDDERSVVIGEYGESNECRCLATGVCVHRDGVGRRLRRADGAADTVCVVDFSRTGQPHCGRPRFLFADTVEAGVAPSRAGSPDYTTGDFCGGILCGAVRAVAASCRGCHGEGAEAALRGTSRGRLRSPRSTAPRTARTWPRRPAVDRPGPGPGATTPRCRPRRLARLAARPRRPSALRTQDRGRRPAPARRASRLHGPRNREAASREAASREAASREAASRERPSREASSPVLWATGPGQPPELARFRRISSR